MVRGLAPRSRTGLWPWRAALGLLAALCLAVPFAGTAQGATLIRDAEIEDTIRAYATPIFRAAGLNPQSISVYLVQDRSLNAFVTNGLQMFIHTGLLMDAEDPMAVIGVIAHETGHISGGHVVAYVHHDLKKGSIV